MCCVWTCEELIHHVVAPKVVGGNLCPLQHKKFVYHHEHADLGKMTKATENL